MRIAHISMIFHLLGYSGNSEPSVNLNSLFIHLLIHSVNQYGGPLHTKHHEGWFWTQGLRWTSSKDARVTDRRNLLHSGASCFIRCSHGGGWAHIFPWNLTPSPLNLLALERRWFIFLTDVDKGCCCPRAKGLLVTWLPHNLACTSFYLEITGRHLPPH